MATPPAALQPIARKIPLHRSFGLLMLCVLTALALAIAWKNHQSEQSERAQMRQQTSMLAMAFAEHTETTLKIADHILQKLRDDWKAHPNTFDSAIANRTPLLGDAAMQVSIIAADGTLAYSNLDSTPARVDLSDREHFAVHRNAGINDDRLFISRPIKGRVSGKWSIQLTRPIIDSGRFTGVIVLSIDPGYFMRYYQRFDLGERGTVTVLRDSGEIMARSVDPEGQIGRIITSPAVDPAAPPQGHFYRAALTDGTERLYSYYRLPEQGLSVVIGVGVQEQLATVRKAQYTSWLIAGATALLLIGMSWLLWRNLARLETAEQVLNQDRQRLADIIFGTNVGTWEWNVQTGETVFNERWAEIIGYRLEEIAPVSIETWMKFAHPDDLQRSGELLEKHFSGEIDHYEYESRMRHKDGHWVWVLDRGKLISRTADGKPLWMSGTHQEITQRKEAEQRLQEAEALLRSAMESTGEAFVIFDADDRLVFCNEKYRELYSGLGFEMEPGVRFEEIVRNSAKHGLYKKAVGREEEWIAERLATHQACDQDWLQPLDDGRWLKTTERRTPSGHTVGFRTDVTEFYRAKEAAEAANVAKSRFLATMSHEIRTPMNGILGMAQMLLMPGITEAERLDYARVIANSGQALLALLNDILDVSKVEAGKMQLEATALEPEQIIHETRALYLEAARSKKLEITGEWHGTPEHPNQRYRGDSLRLRQMLANLTSNAIKFTPRGQIRIAAQEIERDAQQAVLEFSVFDTGIGIPKDKQAQLFQPFTQADSATTRQYGGTGLGLSIVLNLARLMGGDAGLESREGQGSRFWFRVRVGLVAPGTESRSAPRENPAADSAAAVSGKLSGRILVVDDSLTNHSVIKAMLNRPGLHCDFVEDGQQAVDAITQGHVPDLVLMDCQMPIMDGYEATRRLRLWESENGQPRLPIVALTASAFEEDRQRCEDAGMDDYLTKPIDLRKLIATLGRWLREHPSPPPPQPTEHATPETSLLATTLPDSAWISTADQANHSTQEDTFPILDTAHALDLLDGDKDTLHLLMQIVRQQTHDDRSEIARMNREKDPELIKKISHRLKGSVGQIGAIRTQRVCEQLEAAAASGNYSSFDDLLQKLENELDALEAALDSYLGEVSSISA